MDYYKYIFIILVYRNSNDLKDCLDSIRKKVHSCKVIVVNAYYDDVSLSEIEKIANQYKCDFIGIENKGYSYGNNKGIEFAQKKYLFDYIVISNPDIVIEKYDDSFLDENFKYDIIAPQIIAASGKAQNPAMFKRLPLSEYFIYCGYKKNSRLLLVCGLTISKIVRLFISNVKKIRKQHVYGIYCAHGSFLLLSKRIVESIKPVYDDRLFLFGEEGVLAYKAKKAHFETCYSDFISIKHKEDGSMKLSDWSINGEMKKSNIFYYEHYVNPSNNLWI